MVFLLDTRTGLTRVEGGDRWNTGKGLERSWGTRRMGPRSVRLSGSSAGLAGRLLQTPRVGAHAFRQPYGFRVACLVCHGGHQRFNVRAGQHALALETASRACPNPLVRKHKDAESQKRHKERCRGGPTAPTASCCAGVARSTFGGDSLALPTSSGLPLLAYMAPEIRH